MVDGATLRSLIREVIATELAAVKGRRSPHPASAECRVRIAGDADLAAFARQVLSLAEDPAVRQAIAAGTYAFRLDPPGAGKATPAGNTAAGTARIDEGVVTEKTLARLPQGTSRLCIGPGVTVTPLARDKALGLKITIERIRP